MKLLEGKKALIFGIANKNSIAYGIAQKFHEHGATLGFSYGIPQLERRVNPLADEMGVNFVERCDVSNDEDISAVFQKAAEYFGSIDISCISPVVDAYSIKIKRCLGTCQILTIRLYLLGILWNHLVRSAG